MKKAYIFPKCKIVHLNAEQLLVKNSGGTIDVKEGSGPPDQSQAWAKYARGEWDF